MQTLDRTDAAVEARQAAQSRPFHAKDLLKQVVISSIAVAPDGSSVVYVRRTVEEGKYARRLWRTTFRGGRPEQLTSARASDGRPRFSPDGKNLAFISDRSGKPQAWVMSLAGGEPRQLADIPGGVGLAEWSPDSRRLLLVAASGEKRFLVGSADDPVARRIRDYTWRMDGLGYRDEHSSIWLTDLAGGKPRRVTAPSYNVEVAAWSPDGAGIAFTADRRPEAALEEFASVWAISPDAAKPEPRSIAALKGAVFNLAWAPLEQVAFVGIDRDRAPGWSNVELHVVEGDRHRRLGADRDLNIQNSSYGDYMDRENFAVGAPLVALDAQHVLSLVAHKGSSHPYSFGADGEIKALAEPDAVCTAIAAGGGRVAVVASGGGPSEVYAVEDGSLRLLTTDGSRWFGPFRQPVERVSIEHPDGHGLDTWVLRGRGREARSPLVLVVHGGPHASFGPTPWLEMTALSNAGFNVVWSNPRGSASYGEEFTRAVAGRWGDLDAGDLLRVVGWAVEQGLVDPQHVGIMGLSYGGFMTNWMLGHHPGVFAAAVSENPVSDMLAEYASADFGRTIGRAAIGAENPWEDAEKFLERSPYVLIHRNHAPLLLLQAESDQRCPAGQSEMVFAILRTLGREVEMVRYPGESHAMLAFGRPDRRVDRIERIVDWFERHLKADPELPRG